MAFSVIGNTAHPLVYDKEFNIFYLPYAYIAKFEILAFAMLKVSMLSSVPIHFLPSCKADIKVVPLPAKGSNISSFGLVVIVLILILLIVIGIIVRIYVIYRVCQIWQTR
jgi:hypothetical protein